MKEANLEDDNTGGGGGGGSSTGNHPRPTYKSTVTRNALIIVGVIVTVAIVVACIYN